MSDVFKEPKSGGEFGEDKESAEVPAWFVNYLYAALKSPLFSVPKPFETWMIDKVASSGFDVPISQVIGFTLFAPQEASVLTASEATTSTNYADLTTVGPTISGLPDGVYLVQHGCRAKASVAGNTAVQSVSANGAAASDSDAVMADVDQFVTVSAPVVVTLAAGGNNSITCKYRVSAGTGTFHLRRLVVARISNA